MVTLTELGPSPEHARYQALMPQYWRRIEQQETDLVKRGLPAHGYAAFARTWFDAWANQDLDTLRDCLTEDCGFIDSSTFQHIRHGREITVENCRQCFAAFPDIAFYPQDDTLRSLPYADYSEEQWRVVIPWRGIARFTGAFYVPETTIKVAPTGQCLNFIGIDRYPIKIIDGQWKIGHIDTDYDLLYFAAQLAPFTTPTTISPTLLRGAMALERLLVPTLRTLTRTTTKLGTRTRPTTHATTR